MVHFGAMLVRERGAPRLSDAVATTGGIGVAIGVLLIAIDLYAHHPGRPAEVALFAAIIGAGYVVLLVLPKSLHPAGVTLVVAGIPGVFGWWLLPHAHRFADVRPFLILTILGLALCWLAPLTRGKVIFVGLALVLTWLWVLGEVAGNDAYSAAPVPSPPPHTIFSLAAFSGQVSVTIDDLDPADPLYPLAQQCDEGDLAACDSLNFSATPGSDFQRFGATCGNTFIGTPGDCVSSGSITNPSPFPISPVPRFQAGGSDDKSLEIGLVSLMFGLLYLLALFRLDRAWYVGLGTAFVVPAALALFSGTETLGNAAHHAWVGGVLTVIGGIAFGIVGHLSGRRFTAWFGGLAVGVGAVTVALDVSHISRSTSSGEVKLVGPGLIVIVFGAVLVAVAYGLAQLLDGNRPGWMGPRGSVPIDPEPEPPVPAPPAPVPTFDASPPPPPAPGPPPPPAPPEQNYGWERPPPNPPSH